MINPYLAAMADLLENEKVSSCLGSMMPAQMSMPLGFTYKIFFDFKVSQATIDPKLFNVPP